MALNVFNSIPNETLIVWQEKDFERTFREIVRLTAAKKRVLFWEEVFEDKDSEDGFRFVPLGWNDLPVKVKTAFECAR